MSRFTLNIEGKKEKRKEKERSSWRDDVEVSINIVNDYFSVANFSEKPKRYWPGKGEQFVGFTIFNADNMATFDKIFCLARA